MKRPLIVSLIAALLLPFAPCAYAGVTPPSGWVKDPSMPADSALYRPKAREKEKGAPLLYVGPLPKKNPRAFESTIQEDIASMKKTQPKVQIAAGTSLRTADGKEAKVYNLTNQTPPIYQATAYINEKSEVILIALSARTQADYNSSLPVFQAMVKSYKTRK